MYQIPKTICFIFIPIHSFYSGTLIIYFIPIHSFYSGTSSDEEEKENAKVIEIIIDKDFILWKNRRQIMEENKNLDKLSNYIKLSYLYLEKLKIEESTALTGSCNVVFQRRLP
jgi:hypothetical protein